MLHYSVPDLQSFPLIMLVSHILDPDCQGPVKKISIDTLHRVNQPIIVVDPRGMVVTTNKAFDELCCHGSAPNRDGKLFHELDCTNSEIIKILDFGIPILNYRDKLVTDDHTDIPVNLHIYPIFGNNKTRSGAVCLVHDITREVSYNKLLKQSEIILNTINTGVIAVDNSLKITMLNKYAELFFHASRQRVTGQPLEGLIKQYSENSEQFLNDIKQHREVRDRELVLQFDNQKHYYICDTHLLKNDQDEPDGMLLFFKNITKFKHIELQLARSEKLSAIGQLAAGMAHEIRNPLTTVRGFLQIIHQKHRNMGITEFDDHVNLMLAEIDRVNHIIKDFLNLAKPKETRVQPLDINQLLNEVVCLVENEALRRSVVIYKLPAPSLPPVAGDKDQLSQVFLNIITNAFQAMDEKGVLTIRTAAPEGQSRVVIDFIDTGTGIPEELLGKIFDPFVSTKEEGTGLGLAISNRIIADHGGEIKVSSEPGEGTTFTVILPAGGV